MQVYVGSTRSKKMLKRLKALGWGRVFCDGKATPYQGEPWMWDNGAYVAHVEGWDLPKYELLFQRRLDHDRALINTPSIAVLPDILGKGERSFRYSLQWLQSGKLPEHWPWYLAVQDGMTAGRVYRALLEQPIDGVFLGGSDKFKATAASWAYCAHRAGKKFHYARASTPKKVRYAVMVNSDSLDSSFPLWTEERFDTFVLALTEADPQSQLPLVCPDDRRNLWEPMINRLRPATKA